MKSKRAGKKLPRQPKFWFHCLDGEDFVVNWRCMYESVYIRTLFREGYKGQIPIKVTRNILYKANLYCVAHYEYSDDIMEDFDSDFIKDLGLKTLVALMEAAYHLGIRSLWNLTCTAIVDMMGESGGESGGSAYNNRQIFKIFKMKNYFPDSDINIEWARTHSHFDFKDMM